MRNLSGRIVVNSMWVSTDFRPDADRISVSRCEIELIAFEVPVGFTNFFEQSFRVTLCRHGCSLSSLDGVGWVVAAAVPTKSRTETAKAILWWSCSFHDLRIETARRCGNPQYDTFLSVIRLRNPAGRRCQN